MHACMYVCMYVCMNVCIYVCMYVMYVCLRGHLVPCAMVFEICFLKYACIRRSTWPETCVDDQPGTSSSVGPICLSGKRTSRYLLTVAASRREIQALFQENHTDAGVDPMSMWIGVFH